MDTKAQAVGQKVKDLYLAQHSERDPWTDWLWEHHVLWVADKATEIATNKGLDAGLCRVAALLHDIADTVTNRFDELHEQKSLDIARELLEKAGYDTNVIDRLVNDALQKHGCRGDVRPDSPEGKVLATADGLAHLQTGFFMHAFWWKGQNNQDYAETMEWAAKKTERDFHNKLQFDDIKEKARLYYEALRTTFSA